MTNEEILNILKVKYQLACLNKKELRKALIPKKNYELFVNTLVQILRTQGGYIFEINDRLNEILETTERKASKANRYYNNTEIELSNYLRKCLSEKLEIRVDFKSQYESICKSRQFPAFGPVQYSYKNVAKDNYINFCTYLEQNKDLLLFKDDTTFLVTINELLSLYSGSLDNDMLYDFYKIIDNSKYKDSSTTKSMINLLNKKMTLKKLSNLLKERTVENESEKTLSKKL